MKKHPRTLGWIPEFSIYVLTTKEHKSTWEKISKIGTILDHYQLLSGEYYFRFESKLSYVQIKKIFPEVEISG